MAVLIFDMAVVLILSAAVLTAYQWPFATGLFPLTIGIPALLVSAGQLGRDLFVMLRGPTEKDRAADEHIHDIAVDRSVPIRIAVRRAGIFFAWIAGLFALILLIGFKVAIPLFMLAYLKLSSRAGWTLTLLLIAVVLALMLGVFDRLLHIPWPDSLVPLPPWL
jgi:hypothetical protein